MALSEQQQGNKLALTGMGTLISPERTDHKRLINQKLLNIKSELTECDISEGSYDNYDYDDNDYDELSDYRTRLSERARGFPNTPCEP